jgi:radical SAM superfamily enzyme YgiQ (UPF0313 family)
MGEGERRRFVVTLLRPPAVAPKWSLSSGILTPPIGLAYIAACLRREGYRVCIIDPIGEAPFEVNNIEGHVAVSYGWSIERIVSAIPRESRYIGVSCMFSHEWPITRQMIYMIRSAFPEAVIIGGGEHITAIPEFSLVDCRAIDYAVLGEGEETIVELIDRIENGDDVASVDGIMFLRNGVPTPTRPRRRIHDLDSLPWPAWDLLPIENYLKNNLSFGVSEGPTLPIVATRGCPYRCTFCSGSSMWGNRWYARSPGNVVDEIETYVNLYNVENFDFYDLTPIFNRRWIVDLCRELIRRRLDISWQIPAGTRSEIIDEEVASLMARAGHRNLVYAPESGSERTLKLINKRVHLPAMLDSMRAAVRAGLSIKLNMVFGFPQDSTGDILRSYKFLARAAWIGVDDVTISTFIPYPGSELFRELRQKGRIRRLDDEYFYSLLVMGDVRSCASFSERIGRKRLLFYRLFGMACFYLLSFLLRPKRPFQTLWHLYKGRHTTRIEKAMSTYIGKLRLYNRP